MHIQRAPAPRSARPHAVWPIGSIGRSLLPVLGIMVLAIATAAGAWLLLFAVDYGCRLFGGAG